MTLAERADSLTGCTPASSLLEKSQRRSLCRGGEVSPTSSAVASESDLSSPLGSPEDAITGEPGGREAVRAHAR